MCQPIRLVRLPETPCLEPSAMRLRLDNTGQQTRAKPPAEYMAEAGMPTNNAKILPQSKPKTKPKTRNETRRNMPPTSAATPGRTCKPDARQLAPLIHQGRHDAACVREDKRIGLTCVRRQLLLHVRQI
jgi:hypothetical protein